MTSAYRCTLTEPDSCKRTRTVASRVRGPSPQSSERHPLKSNSTVLTTVTTLHTNNPPSTTIIPRFDFTNSPHLYETSIPRYIEGARKETVIREAEVIIAGRQASQGDIGYRTPDKGRLANAGRERISREPAATEPRIFKEVIGKIWAKYQEAQRAGSSP